VLQQESMDILETISKPYGVDEYEHEHRAGLGNLHRTIGGVSA
jgi:hypothetical protein